jgi:MFS family permease
MGGLNFPNSAAMTDDSATPWYRLLNRHHWFVFIMASLAWMFDCLDQQLFNLARDSAMAQFFGKGSPEATKYGGIATAIFVAGWAMGGLIFGTVGDRVGRARMLTITVLMYSLFTGLSAFSKGFVDFAVYRFITGLGVGGVFGLAVALVADTLPDRARPHALGLFQALSAVGNVTAALIAIVVGWMEATQRIRPGSSWSSLFLIGAAPAFLVVFIAWKMKEPEKWVRAREAGQNGGAKMGSYGELLGNERWSGRAWAGLVLCLSGVVGVWGIGFFSPKLIGDVLNRALASEVKPEEIDGYKTIWKGITLMMQNVGAFLGMMTFTKLAGRYGRKPVFAVAFLAALVSTFVCFRYLETRSQIFWMIPLMGFCQMSLFAGYAIYLPELFPVNLRSTGTSFCYNVGRFIAAAGPWTLGYLAVWLAQGSSDAAKLEGFREACCWMSLIFLVGMAALKFLPETKGRLLPEDEDAAAAAR